jgi:hypothetical protein
MVNNHTVEGKSPCCNHKSSDSHDIPNDIILGFATGDTNFRLGLRRCTWAPPRDDTTGFKRVSQCRGAVNTTAEVRQMSGWSLTTRCKTAGIRALDRIWVHQPKRRQAEEQPEVEACWSVGGYMTHPFPVLLDLQPWLIGRDGSKSSTRLRSTVGPPLPALYESL